MAEHIHPDPGNWGHAVDLDSIAGEVAIVGVGETAHSRSAGRTSADLACDAIEAALADAHLAVDQVDGLMFSGRMMPGFDLAFRSRFGHSGPLWVSDRGGAAVYAGSAPYEAAMAQRSGAATYVVNAFGTSWATDVAQGTRGPDDAHRADPMKASFEIPFGWIPQPVYFAAMARRHMHEFGTTAEQLGTIAAATRRHATLTPGAMLHERPLTLEDYLDQPMLVDPLRKADCCLISDGAGAFLMTSAERAEDMPNVAVSVVGVGVGRADTGMHWSQQAPFTSTPQVFAAPAAYAMAGISPNDVDVLAVYDPFTIVALMQIEDMGFCPKGEAGHFVTDHGLDYLEGALPYNTHGGMLAHSYTLGIDHVVELVLQLRRAAAAQVPDCDVAVYAGYGDGASTLILERGAGR